MKNYIKTYAKQGIAVLAILVSAIALSAFDGSATADSNCSNPPSVLSAHILATGEQGGGAMAMVQNSSSCSFDVGMASYAGNQLSDSVTAIVGPWQIIQLHVNVPTCNYEIDVFHGPVLNTPNYGVNLLDRATGLSQSGSCGSSSTPTPTATPAPTPAQSVAPTPLAAIPATCTENAAVSLTGPSTLNPGQTGTFNAHIVNTGSSWWYHGGYFQFVQKSNLTITPSYGHYSPSMHTGDSRDFSFTLTAPTTPGTYTLRMQNLHRAGADYELDNGTVCGATATSDVFFGQEGVATFVVAATSTPTPTPVLTATPTPTPGQCTMGTIVVNSNNNGLGYSLMGPNGQITANGNNTFTNQATGNYTINLNNSNGNVVIAPTTNILACNSTIIFNIVVLAPTPVSTPTPTAVPTPVPGQCTVGTLVVNSNNSGINYSIMGPNGVINANGNNTFTNQATGNYSIQLNNSNGNVLVTPTTNTLACNSNVTFSITALAPAPVIVPTPVPAGSLAIQKYGRNVTRHETGNYTSVSARAGDEVEFSLIVTAPTNTTLSNVNVQDYLPAGLQYVYGSTVVNNTPITGSVVSGVNVGTLANGQQVVIRLLADVTTGAANGQTFVNVASVRADNYGTVNSNQVVVTVNGNIIAKALHIPTGPADWSFAFALMGSLSATGVYLKRKGVLSLIRSA